MDLDLGKLDFGRLIPIIKLMPKEERKQFILDIAEVIARGLAEGAVRGGKNK